MPIFRQIDLVLGEGFSDAERKAVTGGSRSMLNFVERGLSVEAFASEISKLNVHCSRSSAVESFTRYKEPRNLAAIHIQHGVGDLTSSSLAFHEACAEMVRRGIRAASSHVSLPVDEVVTFVGKFMRGGCVNEWVHADKRWSKIGVRCILRVELRTDCCLLRQQVYRDGVLETQALIAKTLPREWLFYPLLGQFALSRGRIVLRSKGKVISIFHCEKRTIEIAEGNERAAQPGATDNPGDAQRSREDH